jgi:hypothetical protein
MNSYSLTLFLHFAGMAGLFLGYGLEWGASTLLGSAANADQARAWLRIYRLSLPISGPGLLLLIFTGFYMAGVTYVSKEGWVMASLLAIVVALAVGFGLILPRMRSVRGALPEGNAPLSSEALRHIQNPLIPTLIRVRTLLALGIVYLMTIKPAAFGTSLLILLAAGVVGLLFSAPAWSSRKSS